MPHEVSAVDVLGGRKVFGRVATGTADLLGLVRRGLPYQALESVMRILDLHQGEIAELLHIRPRTLARRKHDARLQATESDRLYRIARITAHAIDVFEDEAAARHWLQAPSRVLGEAPPLSLLVTVVRADPFDLDPRMWKHGTQGH